MQRDGIIFFRKIVDFWEDHEISIFKKREYFSWRGNEEESAVVELEKHSE
jgi:hypothetical protein